jgi:hypothetical protein
MRTNLYEKELYLNITILSEKLYADTMDSVNRELRPRDSTTGLLQNSEYKGFEN